MNCTVLEKHGSGAEDKVRRALDVAIQIVAAAGCAVLGIASVCKESVLIAYQRAAVEEDAVAGSHHGYSLPRFALRARIVDHAQVLECHIRSIHEKGRASESAYFVTGVRPELAGAVVIYKYSSVGTLTHNPQVALGGGDDDSFPIGSFLYEYGLAYFVQIVGDCVNCLLDS